MERIDDGLVFLTPEDYRVLGEADFGVPGLIAHELVGPFVDVQAVGPMIMVHDGRFEPRHGIGHHPHRYNERLFYILEGAVDHDDALNGIQGHMPAGSVGQLTEGLAGMLHKEWNNTDGPGRAFILVYETQPVPPRASFALLEDGDAPRYREDGGAETKELVGARSPLRINGDVRLFADSALGAGTELTQPVGPGEALLLYTLDGQIDVSDGAKVSLPFEHTLLMAPSREGSSVVLRSEAQSRVIRVVAGLGHGLVFR
ncbi:MAG TPA: pirin family protein [Actinomycetota bacterium]|nr:pirin family protein [Actinomycetota bacterium]